MGCVINMSLDGLFDIFLPSHKLFYEVSHEDYPVGALKVHFWMQRPIAGIAQILAARSRKALDMTETELRLMAAAAIMGLSRIPKTG